MGKRKDIRLTFVKKQSEGTKQMSPRQRPTLTRLSNQCRPLPFRWHQCSSHSNPRSSSNSQLPSLRHSQGKRHQRRSLRKMILPVPPTKKMTRRRRRTSSQSSLKTRRTRRSELFPSPVSLTTDSSWVRQVSHGLDSPQRMIFDRLTKYTD